MTDRLRQLLHTSGALLTADLAAAAVHDHPTPRGAATESGWGRFLSKHLPYRYEVTQGFVVDHRGRTSDQIDLIVFDRHFTPVLYDDDAARYVPAESVYAVFEVKQTLNKAHFDAASTKAASVRGLERTSIPIPSAAGVLSAKDPFPIICGLLATRSDWTPPFGTPLREAIDSMTDLGRLDLIVALADVAAEIAPDCSGRSQVVPADGSVLPWFFLTLVHRLQERGTVGAIDHLAYRTALSTP